MHLPRTKMPKNLCRCSLTPKRWSSTPLSLSVSYTSQLPSKEQNIERGQREQLYSGEIWKHGLNLRVKGMLWWEVVLITCDSPLQVKWQESNFISVSRSIFIDKNGKKNDSYSTGQLGRLKYKEVQKVLGLPRWLSGKESFCQCRRLRFHLWRRKLASHFSILSWEIPWTEGPGELQSIGSQKSWTWLSD